MWRWRAPLLSLGYPHAYGGQTHVSDLQHCISSLGEEQRRATDEATLRRGLALARRLQLAHGRGVELQERGDHLVYSSVCVLCVRTLCVQQP